MFQPLVDAGAAEAMLTLSYLNRILKHQTTNGAEKLFVNRVLKTSHFIAHWTQWFRRRLAQNSTTESTGRYRPERERMPFHHERVMRINWKHSCRSYACVVELSWWWPKVVLDASATEAEWSEAAGCCQSWRLGWCSPSQNPMVHIPTPPNRGLFTKKQSIVNSKSGKKKQR